MFLAYSQMTAHAQTTVLVVDRAADVIIGCPGGNFDCLCRTTATDCFLRQAIAKANAESGTTQITFADSYTIELLGPLPPITADNVTIDGSPHQPIISGSENGIAYGLVIEGDGVTINDLELTGFDGDHIRVASGAQDARISNNNILELNCSPDTANETVGINVIGDISATTPKAYIWRNIICGMNVAGIKLTSTAEVNVGIAPTSDGPGERNIMNFNRVGLEVYRSCDITHKNDNIQTSIAEGMLIELQQNCLNSHFSNLTVKNNGGVGIRKVLSEGGNSVTRAFIRPFEITDNGDEPIAIALNAVTTPVPQSYDANTNTLRFQISSDTNRVYLYKMSSDPTSSGGGGTYVGEVGFNGGITSYPVNLDNYPTLNETNTVLIAGRADPSNLTTSEMSAPYVPTTATVTTLVTQQASMAPHSHMVMLVAALIVLIGVTARLRRVGE